MTDNPVTEEVPELLAMRVGDPKRFLQAARGLAVLEEDLHTLLEKGGVDSIDSDAVAFAAERYTTLRTEMVKMLDTQGSSDADDPIIGMPTLAAGNVKFPTLLLTLSQATRFIGVEENWPGIYLATKSHTQQLAEQHKMLGAGITGAAVAELGSGSPGGYA